MDPELGHARGWAVRRVLTGVPSSASSPRARLGPFMEPTWEKVQERIMVRWSPIRFFPFSFSFLIIIISVAIFI